MRLLGAVGRTPEEQEDNNRNGSLKVIAGAVATLVLYMYLFTRLHQYVSLPSPQDLAGALGVSRFFSFERGGYFYPHLSAAHTNLHTGNVERMILFPGLIVAFLAVYFAKVRHKKGILAGSFLALMFLLYQWQTVVLFVGIQLSVYLCFHPVAKHIRVAAFMAGFFVAIGRLSSDSVWAVIPRATISGVAVTVIYASFGRLILFSNYARWLRLMVSQSAIIAIGVLALLDGTMNLELRIPTAFMLFFLQWTRLMFYAMDYEDGRVRPDQGAVDFLSTFMTPALLPNWGWGGTIAQGYGYQSDAFLARDKNRVAFDGVKLLGVALAYFLFGGLLVGAMEGFFEWLGVTVYTRIPTMLENHLVTRDAGTATVLLTCVVHELRWLLTTAGIFHFLVALWRLFGFDVAQQVRYPLLGTNLVSLWARYMYHYREFLVRKFYYPVFFRLSRLGQRTRVVIATFAAAGIGNMFWGVMPQEVLGDTIQSSTMAAYLRSWPYFVLLASGISVTELWLLGRRNARRPWTSGWRMILDVIAVYLTLQYFMLISIFFYTTDKDIHGSAADYVMMFLRGFGIV